MPPSLLAPLRRNLPRLLASLLLAALLPGIHPAGASRAASKVYGTVYYSDSPLQNVIVDLMVDLGTPEIARYITGADGAYQFDSVASGEYWLKVWGPTPEFVPRTITPITVGESDLQQDFSLHKEVRLLFPLHTSIVETSRPLFCWQGLPEAATYRTQLDNLLGPVLTEHNTNCARPSGDLENGARYTWQVDAYNAAGTNIGYTWYPFDFTLNTTPISTTVQPGSSGNLVSWDGNIELAFPPGSLSQPNLVTYRRIIVGGPPNLVDAQRAFEVTCTSCGVIEDKTFNVTVNYTQVEKGTAIESTLALYRLEGSAWVKIPGSSVDILQNRVSAEASQFGQMAVFGEARRLFLPVWRDALTPPV